jgi:hypothetical protein
MLPALLLHARESRVHENSLVANIFFALAKCRRYYPPHLDFSIHTAHFELLKDIVSFVGTNLC